MSTDLDRALCDVAADLDEAAPTITVNEILATSQDVEGSVLFSLTRPSQTPRRRSLLVAVAAALVLLGVGLVAVVSLRETPSTANQPDQAPPPLPTDLPATGVVFSPEDTLALSVAQETLIAECMAEKGFDYPLPTTDELIAAFGEWQPHAVLGIQRAGAARRVGYHSAGIGGFGTPSQANTIQLMDAEAREAFDNALAGPDPAEPTAPDAATGPGDRGGCQGEVLAASLMPDENFRAAVNNAAGIGGAPSGAGFDDVALDDPRVQVALQAWSTCVEERTGEQAATPAELARRFLAGNHDGSATEAEITVATADAECQQQADLWHTWYSVVAELTRNDLGIEASLYDEWTRHRVEMVTSARSTLTERAIDLPPLE